VVGEYVHVDERNSFSPSIWQIKVTESSRRNWAVHVVRLPEMKNSNAQNFRRES
jgi:hypothetical protein